MPKISLMQISDMHLGSSAVEGPETLVSSIISDMSRYQKKGIMITKPNFLVVCGDLVQGSVSSVEEIEKQYKEAEVFLEKICDEAFNGNKDRVIIVPGNHDVSWPHSMQSMSKIQSADKSMAKLLNEPNKQLRWNWDDLSYYRISDMNRYNQRFLLFSKFYKSFYRGNKEYSLFPEEQFNLFEFEDEKLLFAGFNSCFYNDHLNTVGMINPACIGNCHTRIKKGKYENWVKIAVWHHGIHGIPMQNDFMDERIIQYVIDKGFTMGVHGHQHKSDLVDVKFSADHLRNMFVFGCGTLSAPNEEVPYGENRQYGIIEIDAEKGFLRFHVRKGIDQPPGLPIWMPGNVKQNFDKSYIDVNINKPIRVGKPVNTKLVGVSEYLAKTLVEIDELVTKKEYPKALEKLRVLDQTIPFVRRWTVECLFQLEYDDQLVDFIKDPKSITEFSYVCEAFWRLRKFTELREVIDKKRATPEIAASQPFIRFDNKLKDCGK